MKRIINKTYFLVLGAMALITGCTPDEAGSGNGLTNSGLDASFTVTPISANRFMVSGASEGIITNLWNSGTGDVQGGDSREFFFPDAGSYTVTHTACGIGGECVTSQQTIVVTTSDPVSGNLILNGKFEEGAANWTVLTISPSGAAWTFADGKATIDGDGYNQQGIYQAVQVEANQDYAIDMTVSGACSSDTWFEVFVSPTAPVQGNDYSAGGIRFALNTWAGCATSPFNGQISLIGCGDHSGNPIAFTESGTVYIVIKSGGNNINSISIDNVEFRKVN